MATPRLTTPLTSSSSSLFRFVFASSPATATLQPCRHALQRVSAAQSARMSTKRKMQTSTYQPYSLDNVPPPPPRNLGAPETSISRGIPQVHDTRPPQMTEHRPAYQQPDTPRTDSAVTEKEAQRTKPLTSAITETPSAAPSTQAKPKPRSRLRARKAAIKLTPGAVEQLRTLLNQPDPKLIKVGVKNRGCSGLAYNLEFVDKPGAFDELVEQDGVKVLIDSKALFSIIGSEMDWVEDKLNQRFVFHNPNIKEQCGCGESFMV